MCLETPLLDNSNDTGVVGGIRVISHMCVNGKTVVKGLHDLMNFRDIGVHIQVHTVLNSLLILQCNLNSLVIHGDGYLILDSITTPNNQSLALSTPHAIHAASVAVFPRLLSQLLAIPRSGMVVFQEQSLILLLQLFISSCGYCQDSP